MNRTIKQTIILVGIIVILAVALALTSCTANSAARNFGGTETIEITDNQKIINATWKETDLWILTRPMRPEERPETVTFTEKSSFGVMEGTIILKEKKTY
jgi:hypothetical protein